MTYHREPSPHAATDWRDEKWRCPDCGLWTDAAVCPDCDESDPATNRAAYGPASPSGRCSRLVGGPDPMIKSLLLIDLSHIFWTHWHATANEEVGEAFNRTIETVKRISGRDDCTVALCLDTQPYKRKAISADYKAQRDTPEPAALDQFRRVKERLAADGYLLWGAPGYEADDIIATATTAAVERNIPVTIATNDKDLLQLVDDEEHVQVLSTKTGTVLRANDVLEKFGVYPAQMRDYLALVGDTADNIPGVKGVGPKRAAALLKDVGPLDVIMNWAAVKDPENKFAPPATRQALIDSVETMRTAKALVTLMTDAPINFDDLTKPREQKQLVTVEDAEFEEIVEEPVETEPDKTVEPPKSEPRNEEPVQAKDETQAIVVAPRSQQWALALEPQNFQQAWTLAKCFFNSRLFSVASPEAALTVLMTGRSLGLDAATSMRGIHIIEGKPSLSAALIEALVLASGKAEYFQLVESTDEQATYRTKRIGAPDSVTMSWGRKDAEMAGLNKPGSNHAKRPRTMNRWRCAAELARAIYPDVTLGLYVPGELEETTEPVAAE